MAYAVNFNDFIPISYFSHLYHCYAKLKSQKMGFVIVFGLCDFNKLKGALWLVSCIWLFLNDGYKVSNWCWNMICFY